MCDAVRPIGYSRTLALRTITPGKSCWRSRIANATSSGTNSAIGFGW